MTDKKHSCFGDIKDCTNQNQQKEKISHIEKPEEKAIKQSLRNNPGAAINDADDNKVSNNLVKEEVKKLNNNPRNNEI